MCSITPLDFTCKWACELFICVLYLSKVISYMYVTVACRDQIMLIRISFLKSYSQFLVLKVLIILKGATRNCA